MIAKSTQRCYRRNISAGALVLLVVMVAACGDGETRLDQGLDAAGQAEEQGSLIEENQKRVEDLAGSAP